MEIRILIFTDKETSQSIFPKLKNESIKIVGKTEDENTILDDITKTNPDIVLLGLKNENILYRVSQQVYLLRPKSVPVVLTDNYTPEFIQKIIQTGVNYVIPSAIDSGNLIKQLQYIKNNEATRLSSLENMSASNRKSNVITFMSFKGGIGKTTFITNLAIKLASKNRKVAILDFDMAFGDIDIFMNIKNRNTVAELLQEEVSPNADTIRKYMSVHSSGVNVLLSPLSPEYADHITSNQVEKIISSLRAYYDYILIDTSLGFNNVNLGCLDLSSQVICVTGMDISTLKRTKKGISIVNSLIGSDKIKLVVAKEENSRVKIQDVPRALEFPVWFSVPYDSKVALDAINHGSPIVQGNPFSKVSEAYQNMAEQLDGSNGIKRNDGKTNKNKGKKNIFETIKSKLRRR